MLELSAIDRVFLTRFFFALVFYWGWGILSKGIFEPIQSHLGKAFVERINRKSRDLQALADKTCSKLDDLLIGRLADSIGEINQIINGEEIPDPDRERFLELVLVRYKFAFLLKKMGLGKCED